MTIALHDEKDFVNVVKVKDLEKGKVFGTSRWTHSNHESLKQRTFPAVLRDPER